MTSCVKIEPVMYAVTSDGHFVSQNAFTSQRQAIEIKDGLDLKYPGIKREVIPLFPNSEL